MATAWPQCWPEGWAGDDKVVLAVETQPMGLQGRPAAENTSQTSYMRVEEHAASPRSFLETRGTGTPSWITNGGAGRAASTAELVRQPRRAPGRRRGAQLSFEPACTAQHCSALGESWVFSTSSRQQKGKVLRSERRDGWNYPRVPTSLSGARGTCTA